jgi:hypothetical protein
MSDALVCVRNRPSEHAGATGTTSAAFTAIKPATEDAEALLERVTNKRGLVNDAILELESATRKLDDLATRVARLRAECARTGEPARLAPEAAENAARVAAENAARVAAENAPRAPESPLHARGHNLPRAHALEGSAAA